MNEDRDRGLDAIWPGVRAEIQSVRRQRAWRRTAVRITATVCGVIATAALGVLGLRWVAPRPGAFHSWQLQDINSATGVSSDYPLAQGNRLFVVEGQRERQHVACIDKRTGTRLWASDLRFSQCRVAADAQRVYVLAHCPGQSWRCVALEAKSGAVLWQSAGDDAQGGLPSTLTVLRHGLCWTEGNRVVLRESATGRLVWSKSVGSGGLLAAPVRQAAVLFTASAENLYALDQRTGEIRWSCSLAERTPLAGFTRPLLEAGEGRIFCATRNRRGKGVLSCIETTTRAVLWTQAIEPPVKLHRHGGRVFVRSLNLDAFDARTGQPVWQVPVGGCGTLSFRGDRIYLVDTANGGRVLALEAATGNRVWTQTVAGSCNGIVVSDRVGILSGNNRTLYAFALQEKS